MVVAKNEMPKKSVTAMMAMAIMVWVAWRASGGLKAWTPLLMASMPVSAVQPPEKARKSSQISARPVASRTGGVVVALTGRGAVPKRPRWRTRPMRMTTTAPTTKA